MASWGRDCTWSTLKQRVLTEAMLGGDSPGQPLFPWLTDSENNSPPPPTQSWRCEAQREEGTSPQAHSLCVRAGAFPVTAPFVLAPEQVLDAPPRTSGVPTTSIPLPLQTAWWTHHLSLLLRPEATALSREESGFHGLHRRCCWWPREPRTGGPTPGLPCPGPSLAARAAGLLWGRVLG